MEYSHTGGFLSTKGANKGARSSDTLILCNQHLSCYRRLCDKKKGRKNVQMWVCHDPKIASLASGALLCHLQDVVQIGAGNRIQQGISLEEKSQEKSYTSPPFKNEMHHCAQDEETK